MIKLLGIVIVLAFLLPFSAISGSFQSFANGDWTSYTITWQEYNGSTWVTATRNPIYGDQVTISHSIVLNNNLGYSGSETNGFKSLLITSAGNLTTSGTGSLLSIVVGSGDYLSVEGTMIIGGIQVLSGGIVLVKYTGHLTTNVSSASNAGTAIIDGSLTISNASLTVTGTLYGTGKIFASNYTGGGATLFGYARSPGLLNISGFLWTSSSTGDWFTGSNWTRSTSSGLQSGACPNDTTLVTIPSAFGNVTDNSTTDTARAYSLTIKPGENLTIFPNCHMRIVDSLDNQAGPIGLVINSDESGSGSLILPTSAEVNPYKPDATINLYITGNSDTTKMMYHFVSIPVENSSNNTSVLTN